MSRHILAISGKMRAGKDTFAATFLDVAQNRRQPWKRLAFADALKLEVCQINGITLQELEANKDHWRPELIRWGQVRRAEDPDYWIKRVLSEPGNLVIPDLRFANEMTMLQQHHTRFLRVESLVSERETRGKIIDDPISEMALDRIKAGPNGWDWFVFNNGTLRSFVCEARKLSEEILDVLAAR